MTCQIRKANADDEPALEEIERSSFQSGHWLAPDFRAHDCTVLEYDGRVAGFLVVQRVYAGDSGAVPEFEILNIAILPLYRHLGFARKLLNELLSRPGLFYLEVRESNEPALSLYRQLGFQEIARRADYYEDPDESAIVMRAERC